MTPAALETLRYPIGRYTKAEVLTPALLAEQIASIAQFPGKLHEAVRALTDARLDTPYRPDGWTVRKVVHHCADSHLNSYTRFRLALTEDTPTIKPYHEERWAELHDARSMPLRPSLLLLDGLHARWVSLLEQLTEQDLDRAFIHPESGEIITLRENIGVYAWHGAHHLAQIIELKRRQGWL